MAGDDWTVVGSKGRPRKPRRPPGSASKPSDKAGGSSAAATRGARRSAEALAEGKNGEHVGAARHDVANAAMPLPGWGLASGHGRATNGHGSRAKRRQAWVERSPAEKVESLKRSVLDAKRDVAASDFYAALMAALEATDSADSDADEPGDAAIVANGNAHQPNSSSHSNTAANEQRQRANPERSGSSGSGMAIDRASAGSPMATDGPGSPLHNTAADAQAYSSSAHTNGGSPTSYAAAAKMNQHAGFGQQGGSSPAAERPMPQTSRRRWQWADVQELVAYGLGSFESGPVPRCQLALTLLLAEAAGDCLTSPPQLFDPAFTEVDKLLLREVGCALIPRNEHGRRAFGGSPGPTPAAAGGRAGPGVAVDSTAAAGGSRDGGQVQRGASSRAALVYLAHCKPELCDALLNANWTPGQLASFAVIGNSMHTCEDTWAMKSMRRVFAARPSRTLALVRRRAVAETGIPEAGFPITGAFNDVAFHVVAAPGVAAQPPDAGSDSE